MITQRTLPTPDELARRDQDRERRREAQANLLLDATNMARGGYGWEDIYVTLRKDGRPMTEAIARSVIRRVYKLGEVQP